MSLGRSWMVWFIVGFTLVVYISHISRISIGSVVGHNLGAAIRKTNTVLSSGGIAIPVLICSKVGTRVVISNSITVVVDSWFIIGWLFVCWSWGWMVNWGRLI